MSSTPPLRLKVQRRNWLDPRTQQHTQVIVIGHGPVFIRIPIDQAYDVVNRVHDLCEEYERSEQGNGIEATQ